MFPIRDDQPRFSTPFVNYFIIALNVVAFLFEQSIEYQDPRGYGALMFQFGVVPRHITHALAGTGHVSLAGAFLPILTSMFLHAGWLHIIGNMWFLWIFGDNIEDQLGHFQYLVFYLLCGFAAAFAHIVLNAGSNLPTVGASGAISGVMGAYLLLYPRAKVLTLVVLIVFFTFWWLPAWVFLLYWFVLQILSGAQTVVQAGQETGGIAVWAHVGGFVAGLILIKVFPQRARRQRYASW
jgi:membrane associated rhomboid family serine protease